RRLYAERRGAAVGRVWGSAPWTPYTIAIPPFAKAPMSVPLQLGRPVGGGATRSVVTHPVYQRSAAIVVGESRQPLARRPSAHRTSPPPDQSHGSQAATPRSNDVPHWSISPSPSLSRVSSRATRRKSSHVQSSVG